MSNKVAVTICGKSYVINTEDTPNYVVGLAKRLDKQISDMVAGNENISVTMAAVMSALNSMDETNKAAESIDNIRTQIKEYVDDAGRARMERDEAYREIDLLRTKISSLENELKLLKLKQTVDTINAGNSAAGGKK